MPTYTPYFSTCSWKERANQTIGTSVRV